MTLLPLAATTATSRPVPGIKIPENKLAREMTELVRDTGSPLLFHHSSCATSTGRSASCRLPEAQRAAVLRVGLEEMTNEQAAEVLSVPTGTVRSRTSRGRAELRERLLRATVTKATRRVEPGIANRGRRLPSILLPRVPKPISN